MWDARWFNNSFLLPVRILTTPPGTSEEFKTSAKEIAVKGLLSEAKTITVLPPTIAGAITETKPNKLCFSGAIIETTPTASTFEKLKWELDTGLTVLKNCWYLSLHPA